MRHVLRWTVPTADAIRQLLIPTERPQLRIFRLAGREHLAGVTVAATDLPAYGRQAGGKSFDESQFGGIMPALGDKSYPWEVIARLCVKKLTRSRCGSL